ncbi:uncharacterized protein [Montipora capricornis]|uniref:uncharacterized protein n=1 Tax=Montipora capricornis TaxID=246305 RepID=UPI0035F13A7D
MASVPAPAPFVSSKETTNYARLCRLLVDMGTQALRDTFDTIHPPATLHKILLSARPTLHFLKKKVLNPTQWGKLYPTHPSSVSSASFDITLLMVLLRNICSLTPPASTGSWDKLPLPGDNSPEANIARIRFYRNQVYAHASQASVDDVTFNTLWQDISNALLALGSGRTYSSAISRLKTECMDPDVEEHYRKLLKEWKIDDENTKEKLDNLEEMLKELKSVEYSTKDMIGEVQEMLITWKRDTKNKLGEMEGRLGSVLGPVIFNLYAIDMQECLKDASACFQYADDTTVLLHAPPKDLKDCVNRMNNTLQSIESWAAESNLVLNETKTKIMLFTTR